MNEASTTLKGSCLLDHLLWSFQQFSKLVFINTERFDTGKSCMLPGSTSNSTSRFYVAAAEQKGHKGSLPLENKKPSVPI